MSGRNATGQADVSRRDFLAAGAGALALSVVDTCCESTAAEKLGTHHIPADKNLDKTWVDSLFAKGQTKVYRGDELTTIGMPIGGICAGQLYLRGDGTLAEWDIFNHDHFTGYGDSNYRTYTPPAQVHQRFAVWVYPQDGKPVYRELSKEGFPEVEFIGEYPLAKVRYTRGKGDTLPVEVSLESCSPFIPPHARDSAIPGTILRIQVRNTSKKRVDVVVCSSLQNVVCSRHASKIRGFSRNAILRSPNLTTLLLSTEEEPVSPKEVQKPEVFADFESGTYGNWKKSGTAFGDKPAMGTLPNQQKVTGYGGKYLVNSYVGGDDSKGTLTSPEFTIKRPYINFKVGGGNHPGKACINLKVDGKLVRTATGKNNEKLEWDYWLVDDLIEKTAVIEIVDEATGAWGHINIDDIEFADNPPKEVKVLALKDQPDFGTLALTVLDEKADGFTQLDWDAHRSELIAPAEREFKNRLVESPTGMLRTRLKLPAGAMKEVVFLLTWHFAGGEHGRMYGNWFKDALDVAKYVQKDLDRLTKETRLFHDTYYDSTLPHWLLDRIMMPISTLATSTVQWWKNGRFWAWEGVGCCHGTCTHVWNYAHGVARLFPGLERSARIMQDLGPALELKTGRVAFRGEGSGFQYAADGQCGTVLKCYREHLMSKDDKFLKEYWPRIKKVMEYTISRDGNADGVIEDNQHNTFDIDFVGPNTFVGALYLAALEAAARMAELQNDKDFAARCRAVAARGRRWSEEHLWNGEFFVQHIPKGKDTKYQYGDGCLADHLFGQNWANQLGLDYVYSREKVRTALRSIYRYNWAPDIAAQNKAYPPQRWFARPGEAGLFTCTWPKGGRFPEPVLYRDEVWTGSEYQVASHLLWEGMIREGLSIIRGIHDRYDGKRHNPWNEVECGDHYARALASWGCLLALSGFEYDGPAGKLGFAPRWQADDFKAVFTAAEGWGSLRQRRQERSQVNAVEMKYGHVQLAELAVELPEGVKSDNVQAAVREKAIAVKPRRHERRVMIAFENPLLLRSGETLAVTIKW